jgi:hypothetical protein
VNVKVPVKVALGLRDKELWKQLKLNTYAPLRVAGGFCSEMKVAIVSESETE